MNVRDAIARPSNCTPCHMASLSAGVAPSNQPMMSTVFQDGDSQTFQSNTTRNVRALEADRGHAMLCGPGIFMMVFGISPPFCILTWWSRTIPLQIWELRRQDWPSTSCHCDRTTWVSLARCVSSTASSPKQLHRHLVIEMGLCCFVKCLAQLATSSSKWPGAQAQQRLGSLTCGGARWMAQR